MITIPKQARNRVLRDVNKLIIAEYNGQRWSAPDGYFAVNVDIYDGYRVKKDQEQFYDNYKAYNIDKLPKLTGIVHNPDNGDYALAEFETVENETFTRITSTATDRQYLVNTERLEFIKKLYPNAVPFVSINGQYKPYQTPVRMQIGNEIIGVIMPVRE